MCPTVFPPPELLIPCFAVDTNSEQKFDSASGRTLTFAGTTLRMEQHFASLQGVVKAGQASASYASGEAWVPLGRRGRAKGQAWRARTHQCGFGATRNSARGVLCQAGRGGRRPRRDRAGRTPRPAARDALPPCVFRLKGDLDHLHNNNKTSALAAGASTLVPALRHLPPPLPRPAVRRAALPCPRGQAESGPRPSANFSRCHRGASRDPGPGRGRR